MVLLADENVGTRSLPEPISHLSNGSTDLWDAIGMVQYLRWVNRTNTDNENQLKMKISMSTFLTNISNKNLSLLTRKLLV